MLVYKYLMLVPEKVLHCSFNGHYQDCRCGDCCDRGDPDLLQQLLPDWHSSFDPVQRFGQLATILPSGQGQQSVSPCDLRSCHSVFDYKIDLQT